ncbi:MAG TPA: cytochrome c [Stellaceae bacterium]|jgi:cytochrome c553|nr:cytochrome c [Stellaceae bacterium]
MRVGFVAAAAALVICAFAVLVSNAGAQQNGGGQEAAPQGDAKAGQQTFLADGCWECHGTVAQGGAITGPRLAATALPFAAVLQQLRTPQNAMPPYEPASLSDTDAANIYAWLKTLPAAPAASSIPLLSN